MLDLSRGHARGALLGALFVALALFLFTSVAHADGLVVRSLEADPERIRANGNTTLSVVVSGDATAGDPTEVTLSATMGAFGAAGGPNRIVVELAPNADELLAEAVLFGDGQAGTAAVTARIGDSSRSTSVTFIGDAAEIRFDRPADGAVLAAGTSQFVSVEVRDENGAAVPDVTVQLSATGAELSSVGDATGSLELQTTEFGRASATLSGEPGEVVLRASAGGVSESIRLTLHGAPVSLSLIALREVVNLGDVPFAAPAGTLVAILLDDGGRPVPGVRVEFSTDNEGVAVRHEGDSGSVITDGTGHARGHVSAADAETPGLVTVSATAAAELVDSATVRVVGPADALLVSVRSQSVGRFQITALVVDADGNAVPTGYHVDWSTIGLAAGAEALFEPARSAVRDGAGQTVLRIALGDASGILVRAELVEAPDVAVAVALPSSGSAEGTALSSGLNVVVWAGETAAPVSAVAAAIEGLLVAAWRLDGELGWQSYVPAAAARSSDYAVNPGDRLYLYLAAPATLEGVERAP